MKIQHGIKGFVSSLINDERFLDFFLDESEEKNTKKNKLNFLHTKCRWVFLPKRINEEISLINKEIDEIEFLKGFIEPNHYLIKKCDLLFKFADNLKKENDEISLYSYLSGESIINTKELIELLQCKPLVLIHAKQEDSTWNCPIEELEEQIEELKATL